MWMWWAKPRPDPCKAKLFTQVSHLTRPSKKRIPTGKDMTPPGVTRCDDDDQYYQSYRHYCEISLAILQVLSLGLQTLLVTLWIFRVMLQILPSILRTLDGEGKISKNHITVWFWREETVWQFDDDFDSLILKTVYNEFNSLSMNLIVRCLHMLQLSRQEVDTQVGNEREDWWLK